jgi:putative aminopeptidase FrvX
MTTHLAPLAPSDPHVHRSYDETLLLSILEQPSAPFREGHVITRIRTALDQGKVPYFVDPIGNLVIGASSSKEYLAMVRLKTPEPLRIFIAHMDHPGFHGTAWKSPTELEVKWHGGSPTQHIENAKVWLADKKEALGHGKFIQVKMIPSGRAIESGVIQVPAALGQKQADARQLFGGFGFRAPVWKEGELLYTKAADDLVGSFSIVSLALEHFSKGRKKSKLVPFLGLLTRAEEVGFIGAIGHFELGWLASARRQILCVSLETSRTLPGADIGKGPVVRLGDRYTVFNSEALRVFSDLALKILPEKHQRRVMDGGTCEGTTATVYGHPCVGISVPLGNYHNQCFEGGPDSAGPLGPAPEFVHAQDVQGLLDLCRGLLKPGLPWNDPWKLKLKEFKKELKAYRPLLRSGL